MVRLESDRKSTWNKRSSFCVRYAETHQFVPIAAFSPASPDLALVDLQSWLQQKDVKIAGCGRGNCVGAERGRAPRSRASNRMRSFNWCGRCRRSGSVVSWREALADAPGPVCFDFSIRVWWRVEESTRIRARQGLANELPRTESQTTHYFQLPTPI